MIRGITNGDDAVLVGENFIGANDGVGAWAHKTRGHAALWSRLILHFWALEAERDASVTSTRSTSLEPDPVAYLQTAYEHTLEATAAPNEWQGTTTACGALLHHSHDAASLEPLLYVTNLGDSQVMVVRPETQEIVYKTTEQWHWFDCPRQLGTNSPDTPQANAVMDKIKIREGDVVLAMSDGVVDNLWEHEVVQNVHESMQRLGHHKQHEGGGDAQEADGDMLEVAKELVKAARKIAEDPYAESPFMERAVEEGLAMEGGKLDDISVAPHHVTAATSNSVKGVDHFCSHQHDDLPLNLTADHSGCNYKLRLHFNTLKVGTPTYYKVFRLILPVQPDGTGSRLAADVTLDSKVPILQLEDVDPYLSAVECSGSTITLSFNDEGVKKEAEKQWGLMKVFIVIAYHPDCNRMDQRRPYYVWSTSFEDTGTSVTLHVTPLAWLDAFESIDLSLGASDTIAEPVHLDRLQKSVSSSGSPPSPPSGTTHLKASPLDSNLIGKIFPKEGIASEPDNLSINCEPACSIGGSAEITTGLFRISRRGGSVKISKASLQAVFHSFEATVPFRVSMREPGETNMEIPLALGQIAFLPIEIPGLFKLEPSMAPVLSFSFKNKAPFEFSYGFNASIPPESSINFNLGDLAQSSITGFNHIAVDPHRFQSTADTKFADLEFSVALQPRFSFDIEVLGGTLATMGAEVLMDLPKLNVAIDSRPNTGDERCEAAGLLDSEDPAAKGSKQQATEGAEHLAHVTPSYDISASIRRSSNRPSGIGQKPLEEHTIFKKAKPFPTLCLGPDKEVSSAQNLAGDNQQPLAAR
ncbi:MAG: hypothetical protein Q9169_007158 [Polycauliona sp. 2 TL-2023]